MRVRVARLPSNCQGSADALFHLSRDGTDYNGSHPRRRRPAVVVVESRRVRRIGGGRKKRRRSNDARSSSCGIVHGNNVVVPLRVDVCQSLVRRSVETWVLDCTFAFDLGRGRAMASPGGSSSRGLVVAILVATVLTLSSNCPTAAPSCLLLRIIFASAATNDADGGQKCPHIHPGGMRRCRFVRRGRPGGGGRRRRCRRCRGPARGRRWRNRPPRQQRRLATCSWCTWPRRDARTSMP